MERKVKRDDTQYRCQRRWTVYRRHAVQMTHVADVVMWTTHKCSLTSASSFPPVYPPLKPTRNDCYKDYARCGKLRHLKARVLRTVLCERLLEDYILRTSSWKPKWSAFCLATRYGGAAVEFGVFRSSRSDLQFVAPKCTRRFACWPNKT